MKRLFVRWKKPTSTVFAFGLPVGGSICTREDGARLTGGRTARLARHRCHLQPSDEEAAEGRDLVGGPPRQVPV
jgi:hypothetical protein